MTVSHTWMRHRDHGGTAQIADTAVDIHAALGWEQCEPQPDHNPVPLPEPPSVPAAEHTPAVPATDEEVD